jgi:hypothetical protein
MKSTTVVKCEKAQITTWFQCSRCPVETDRGIKVRVDGVSETLCRECYKELLRNRCTGNRCIGKRGIPPERERRGG